MPDVNENAVQLQALAEDDVQLKETGVKIRNIEELGDAGANMQHMRQGLEKLQSKLSEAHGANGEAVHVSDSLAEISNDSEQTKPRKVQNSSISGAFAPGSELYKDGDSDNKPKFEINTSQSQTFTRAAEAVGVDPALTSIKVEEEIRVEAYFKVGQEYDFIRNRPPGQGDRGFIFEQKLTLTVETSEYKQDRNDQNYAVTLVDKKNPGVVYDLVENHSKQRGYQISPLFRRNKGVKKEMGTYSEKKLFEAAMARTLGHAMKEKDKHHQIRYFKAIRLTENMWLNMYPGQFLFPRKEMETIRNT